MARRKKSKEEAMSDAWLLPYADLLTLLLALFIALFSISTLDGGKFTELKNSLNSHLTGGKGFLEHDSSTPPTIISDNKDRPRSEDITREELERSVEEANRAERHSLEKLREQLDEYIADNGLGGLLSTSLDEEGLLIVITSEVLFESGSGYVRATSTNIAENIAKMLDGVKRQIVISGHTDNVPISNSTYRSNWDLSVDRAVNFKDLLVQTSNLTQEQFSVRGFAEYEPVADNETAEGRSKNRRVEVLVEPNLFSIEDFEHLLAEGQEETINGI